MPQSRLSTAIDDGLIILPEGPVAVMRPAATYDVSALPRDDVRIMQTYFPDFTAWQSAGYAVSQDMPAASVAIVVVPRART